MLKASSLFYAIVISLIIALISSSLILFAYFNKQQFQRYLEYERVIRNVDSGMNLLLGDANAVPQNTESDLDLFGSGIDKVFLKRRAWGAFDVAVSKASFRGYSHKKVAMTGANFPRELGLYLADQSKPLSLCGKTIINGTSYLPKSGVKRAYIEGQSFVGSKLVEGEVKISDKSIPTINLEMVKGNEAYLSGLYHKADSTVSFAKAQDQDEIHQSFTETTLVLYSDGPIEISAQSLHGNIILVSATSVYVSRESDLEDVLIYAPEIVIADDFSGSLQAFASKSLVVGKNCNLVYPSVLGLISASTQAGSTIALGEKSNLSGVMFAHEQQMGKKEQMLMTVEKDALVQGQVYSSSLMELKGSIHGSLTCRKFMLRTPSSVYENHLLNAVIDPSLLSEHFLGIQLTSESGSLEGEDKAKAIMQWLD